MAIGVVSVRSTFFLHACKQDGRLAHEPTPWQGVAAFVVVVRVLFVVEDMDMTTRYLVEEAGFKRVAAAVVPHEEPPSLVLPAELCEPPPPAHAVGAVVEVGFSPWYWWFCAVCHRWKVLP